jgi:Golgi SNAP receptor complex protein 1
MAAKSGNWEGLRKQARALENDIDLKLVTFSKLGTNYSRAQSVEADKQPLLGGEDSALDSLQSEIDALLANLGQVNEEMAGYAAGVGEARSAAIHHTLQRHSEILQV